MLCLFGCHLTSNYLVQNFIEHLLDIPSGLRRHLEEHIHVMSFEVKSNVNVVDSVPKFALGRRHYDQRPLVESTLGVVEPYGEPSEAFIADNDTC